MVKRNFLDKIYSDLRKNTFLRNIEQGNSHPQETHVGLSDIELLNRGITHKISVGTFQNELDYQECLVEAIASNKDKIQKFLNTAKHQETFTCYPVFSDEEYQNPEDPYDFNTRNKCFHLDDVNNHISEVTTNAYCLVLRKNDYTSYGFNIVTFYPNANVKYLKNPDINIKKTNKDLNAILEKTNKYQKAPLLEKAALKAQIDPEIKSQIRLKTQRQTYNKVIAVTNPHSNFKNTIEIGFKDQTITNKNDIPIQNKKMQQIVLEKNKQLVKNVEKVEQIKQELLDKQNKKRKIKNKSLQTPPVPTKDRGLEL